MSNKRIIALALATVITVPMEGTRQWAYKDPVGIPTICMGSTKGVKIGDFKTLEECKALLTKEMLDVIDTVDKCQPNLPVEVLAAFADAAYNIGPTIACNPSKSTAAKLLKAKDYRGACDQLLRWDKANVAGFMVSLPGLTKRRKMEQELCIQGV